MRIDKKNFSVEPDGLSGEQISQIDALIECFGEKSPSELELLTRAIYAYAHLEDNSRESIIGGVQKTKGPKYSEEQI